MTTQYHLVDKDFKNNIVVDSAVLVEDGIVWDQAQLQMPLNYENAENVLIENNNDSYLSPHDDGNGTQYFSLLEPPNESVLSDLNDITLYTDGNNHDQGGVNMICALDDQHHNVLAVTESDDLYAFQIAYDEDGHVQKYRFMLRLNENGEYETVPESLELLPEDVELPISQMLPIEEPQAEFESSKIAYQNSDLIVKKEEHQEEEEHETVSNENDDSYHDLQEDNEDEEFYENQMFQENVETKIAVMNGNGVAIHKIEGPGCSLEESNPTFDPSSFADEESENLAPMEPISNSPLNNHSLQTKELPLNSFSTVYALQDGTTHENEGTSNDVFEEEQLIINDENQQEPESAISHDEVNGRDLSETINGNESEEEFQIVDGVHVTADNDGDEDILPPVEAMVTKASEHHVLKLHENMSLLNDALDDIKIKTTLKKNGNKGSKHLLYYVIKDPEKENVASLADVTKKVMKANPRSILKSSFTYFEEKKDNTKLENQAVNAEKKPVKAKEVKGKVIQNFLAKTTIILAPVRQERMPRKQTIKPVKRADEEIIVQEVVVSSNGVIETKEDGVVKSKALLTPTDFVQVSDSDEDYDVRAERKKKKKKKKRRSKVPKIVISDTEDEDLDESIVEIDLSFDSDQEQDSRKDNDISNKMTDEEDSSAITDIKRRRGRPRKRQSSGLEESGSSSSSKKLKSSKESESSDVATPKKSEIANINTKWACSSCTKVFPSQGSLKTHTQYHTYHESANKINSFKKPLSTVFKQKDYQCIICYETFKNNYLLMKHTKEHNDPSKFECGYCKKLFCDQLQLTIHKRSHVKEQMFNSTTSPKDSPKSKKLQCNSISRLQGKYKCTFCSKIFTSQTLLNAHSSLHKRFNCLSCHSTFMSKLILEDHIRHRCVKRSPILENNKFRTPSRRVSIRTDTSNSNIRNNLRPSPSPDKEKKTQCSAKQINLKCDKCPAVFKSHKNLYVHRVLQHGLETPDKSIKMNKTKGLRHKELGKHSSVPAGEKLRNAFANLRTKK